MYSNVIQLTRKKIKYKGNLQQIINSLKLWLSLINKGCFNRCVLLNWKQLKFHYFRRKYVINKVLASFFSFDNDQFIEKHQFGYHPHHSSFKFCFSTSIIFDDSALCGIKQILTYLEVYDYSAWINNNIPIGKQWNKRVKISSNKYLKK